MKRDMDLIRLILLKVEDEYAGAALINLEIEGHDLSEVAIHCEFLKDAGLISSCSTSYADNDIYVFSVGNLTWNGTEYLDKIRDRPRWNKIKAIAKEKGIPLAFESVGEIALLVAKSAIGT